VFVAIDGYYKRLDAGYRAEPLNALTNAAFVMWHILNTAILVWMIEVYRRHMLAPVPDGR